MVILTDDTNKKVKSSIKLLRSVYRRAQQPIEICYSGGKDSDVILRLAQMADIPFVAIHRLSGIDRPGTIAHCLKNNVQIHRPGFTYYDVVKSKGMPTRQFRSCCEKLREYRIKLFAVLGIRREESAKRAKLYLEPVQCRVYRTKAQGYVQQVLPILDYTLSNLADFISAERITLHPHYYNVDGTLNLSRRLGCIGCPLAHDRGLKEYREYPGVLRQTLKSLQAFYDSRPADANIRQLFANAYDIAAFNLLYDSISDFQTRIFRDSKRELEDAVSHSLDF